VTHRQTTFYTNSSTSRLNTLKSQISAQTGVPAGKTLQDHHIISVKTAKGFANTPVFKAAEVNINDRWNRVILPASKNIRAEHYRTQINKRLAETSQPISVRWNQPRDRTIHIGSHNASYDTVVSARMAQLNAVWPRVQEELRLRARNEGWSPARIKAETKQRARQELARITATLRKELKAAEIQLNKHRR
jgi:hypothetical protein